MRKRNQERVEQPRSPKDYPYGLTTFRLCYGHGSELTRAKDLASLQAWHDFQVADGFRPVLLRIEPV